MFSYLLLSIVESIVKVVAMLEDRSVSSVLDLWPSQSQRSASRAEYRLCAILSVWVAHSVWEERVQPAGRESSHHFIYSIYSGKILLIKIQITELDYLKTLKTFTLKSGHLTKFLLCYTNFASNM